MFVLKERRECVCVRAWSGYSFAVVAARASEREGARAIAMERREEETRGEGEEKEKAKAIICSVYVYGSQHEKSSCFVFVSRVVIMLCFFLIQFLHSFLSDVFDFVSDDIKFLFNMMMINTSPTSSSSSTRTSTGSDSNKRLRLTIPRNHNNNKADLLDENKSLDLKNPLNTMKSQLSSNSLDNENDTTLLTTTTTTTTVEVKVKTTKTSSSSSSSRKRKLNGNDESHHHPSDDSTPDEKQQDQDQQQQEQQEQQQQQQTSQSVNKKKVIDLDIISLQSNWSAQDRKEIQSEFLCCAFARHPRGIMISWCVRVCVCIRPIYFSLFSSPPLFAYIDARSVCVCAAALFLLSPCPVLCLSAAIHLLVVIEHLS